MGTTASGQITLVNLDDGRSLASLVQEFYLSTSATTATGGSWSETKPVPSASTYIWSRYRKTWVNPESMDYTDAFLLDDKSTASPYVKGTQDASTALWTGNAPTIASLYSGLSIKYYLNKAPTSGSASLNLTLKDGSTTGAIPCYYSGTSRLTNHYPLGSLLDLTYLGAGDNALSNQAGWFCTPQYYSYDNYDIRYNVSVLAKTAISAYQVIVANDETGYFKIQKGSVFDLNYPVLYPTSSISAGATSSNCYLAYYSINLATTLAGYTHEHRKPVYIVGTISGTEFTVDSDVLFTQAVPTTEDGKAYLRLGIALASATNISFEQSHSVFMYKGDGFKSLEQIIADAYAQAEQAKQIAESAKIISITASSQIFKASSAGTITEPASIELSLLRANTTAAAIWTSSPSVELGGTGDTRTLSIAQFGSNASVRITVSCDDMTDSITIVKVNEGADGADATSIVLTNESQLLSADKDGNVPAQTIVCDAYGFAGSTPTVPSSITVSGLPTGMSATTSATGAGYRRVSITVSAGTLGGVDSGNISLSIACNGVSFAKKLTWAKSKTGATGTKGDTGKGISTQVYTYGVTTSMTAPPASASVTSATIPDTFDSTNKYLWQKEAITYTDATTKESIYLIAVWGASGTPGNPGADAELFMFSYPVATYTRNLRDLSGSQTYGAYKMISGYANAAVAFTSVPSGYVSSSGVLTIPYATAPVSISITMTLTSDSSVTYTQVLQAEDVTKPAIYIGPSENPTPETCRLGAVIDGDYFLYTGATQTATPYRKNSQIYRYDATLASYTEFGESDSDFSTALFASMNDFMTSCGDTPEATLAGMKFFSKLAVFKAFIKGLVVETLKSSGYSEEGDEPGFFLDGANGTAIFKGGLNSLISLTNVNISGKATLNGASVFHGEIISPPLDTVNETTSGTAIASNTLATVMYWNIAEAIAKLDTLSSVFTQGVATAVDSAVSRYGSTAIRGVLNTTTRYDIVQTLKSQTGTSLYIQETFTWTNPSSEATRKIHIVAKAKHGISSYTDSTYYWTYTESSCGPDILYPESESRPSNPDPGDTYTVITDVTSVGTGGNTRYYWTERTYTYTEEDNEVDVFHAGSMSITCGSTTIFTRSAVESEQGTSTLTQNDYEGDYTIAPGATLSVVAGALSDEAYDSFYNGSLVITASDSNAYCRGWNLIASDGSVIKLSTLSGFMPRTGHEGATQLILAIGSTYHVNIVPASGYSVGSTLYGRYNGLSVASGNVSNFYAALAGSVTRNGNASESLGTNATSVMWNASSLTISYAGGQSKTISASDYIASFSLSFTPAAKTSGAYVNALRVKTAGSNPNIGASDNRFGTVFANTFNGSVSGNLVGNVNLNGAGTNKVWGAVFN